eukprot:s3604_g2.t1
MFRRKTSPRCCRRTRTWNSETSWTQGADPNDIQQISEAFRRFDKDSSGFLDATECRHMCAYLGWGSEGWNLFMNKDEVCG